MYILGNYYEIYKHELFEQSSCGFEPLFFLFSEIPYPVSNSRRNSKKTIVVGKRGGSQKVTTTTTPPTTTTKGNLLNKII